MLFTSKNPLSRKKELNRWGLLLGGVGSGVLEGVWRESLPGCLPAHGSRAFVFGSHGRARAPESLLLKDTPIVSVAQLPSDLSVCSVLKKPGEGGFENCLYIFKSQK